MTPEPRNTELWKITLGELDEKMGVKIIEESVERVVATMPVEGNRQPYGLLHGGASVALGESLAVDGVVTPQVLGDASRAGRHDPQALKRVWHYVARFGSASA